MNVVVIVASSLIWWITWVLEVAIRVFRIHRMRRVAMVDFEVVGNVIFWEVFLISGRGEAIGFIFCRIGPMKSVVFHMIDEVTQFWGWNRKLEIWC